MAKIFWNDAPPFCRWNRLRSLRKERGLSMAQLAVGAGLSISVVYHLELGHEDRTTEETKTKLAGFFDCDVDDLFPLERIGNQPREEFLRAAMTPNDPMRRGRR